eukprot:GFUD01041168.1.p1 GENE.GFUD01041168.1~~GFUD01041168.1.p1  ORF type:complete len:371 (+),score=66.81 GFUD01041168.1:720-1832(+)
MTSLAKFVTFFVAFQVTQAAKVAPYKEYRLEALCGKSREKQSLYLHNQAHLFTFNSTNKELLKCHLELHLHSDTFGFSIFTEVMKLDETKDCTRDFLQFGRDFIFITSRKSNKKCGIVEPTKRILRDDGSLLNIDYKKTPHQRREYIEAEDKEMDIWLSIHPPKSWQPNKELKLIVTPFKKKCVTDDHYYRKCPGTDKCIKRELFCDGIINCDGAPKDEQEEYCLLNSSSDSVDMFLSIPIIILIVVFAIVGLMFVIFMVKLFSLAFKPKTIEPSAETERRALRDPIISNSLCNNSNPSRGIRALHTQLSGTSTISTTPSAPSTSESDIEISTLPPHPPSYSEAVGIVYKDDPPKYSELPEDAHEVIFKH